MVPQSSGWVATPDPTFGVTAIQVRDNLSTLPTTGGTFRVRVLLKSIDGVSRPAIDAIRVFYEGTTGLERLVWDDVPATVSFGTAFNAGITAVNIDGSQMLGLNGTVQLTASHGGAVLPGTVTMIDGRVSESIKVLGVADDVILKAEGPNGLVGFSSSFDLVADGGATLEIVSGDGQFGPIGALLGQPMVVRILDAAGTPIPDVQITFAVTEGGGSFDPSGTNAVHTSDANGEARVYYYLGPDPGANRVRASAANLQIDFLARADDGDGTGGGDDDGGCCNTGRNPSSGSLLLLLAVVALLRRRP
jgi:hypothetical protein